MHITYSWPSVFTVPLPLWIQPNIDVQYCSVYCWKTPKCKWSQELHSFTSSLTKDTTKTSFGNRIRKEFGKLDRGFFICVFPPCYFFVVVQLLSHVRLWDPMDCSTPGLPVLHHLPEVAQTHIYWVGDAIQPSHPLWSPSTPAFSLSQHRGLLQWASSSHQVAKDWSFSFSISPSNDYSGLISFRMDWFDLAVQGTLKSLLQHHSSKHQFFSAQPLWSSSHIHTWLMEKP